MSMEPGFMGRFTQDRDAKKSLRQLDKAAVSVITTHLRPYWKTLLFSVLLMAVVASVNAAAPYLIRIAIDDHILPGDYAGLLAILAAYVGLYLVYWIASFWGRYLSSKVGQSVIADVREQMFSHVMRLSQQFYERQPIGNLMSRLVNDVNSISELISYGLTGVVSDIVTLLAIFAAMVYMNPTLALVAFLVIPMILFGTNAIGRMMRSASREVRQKLAGLSAGVEENVAGARAVRAMGREKQSLERLETLSKENYAANLKAIVAVALFFPFMSASGTLSSALVLGVGGGMVRQGALTVGSLLAFLTYVTKFFMPLRELSQLFATYQTAAASAERIYELTQVRPDVKERAEPKELPEQIHALVEFSNVTFGYEPDKRPVLHGLDLRLEPGEVVAVVGRSGSGKTTLVKLLTRLYDPEDGTVSIDGIDIRDVRISRLRQIISVVPQDVFLFDASVAENIALGKPDASREQIEEAARMVGADTFIERLPEKYDTQVGERGSRLSGGQRQLVSFARALVAGSPILVLDEATSSVDAETEARLQRAMIQMFKGRTVLLIAHRFSTLETADKIAVLDKGRIIGVGEHKQLYESNALYRELYDKQSVS